MSEPLPDTSRRELLHRATLGVTGGVTAAIGACALRRFLDPPVREVTEATVLRLSESELNSLVPGTTCERRIGTRTLRLSCLKRGEVRRADLFETGIVTEDRVIFALDTRCPHLGCAVVPDEATGLLRCPCHHSLFDFDGTRREGPAPGNLELFPVAGTVTD
ncbi:MAG: Rieske 2Fe-2S domain-containing protein [Planctomycetia bacterium]|nr:Rieske 2Fe-2S domain-containing protein [Planctomycetia bacterium]